MASAANVADIRPIVEESTPGEERYNSTLSASVDMAQAEPTSSGQSDLTVCQPSKVDAEMLSVSEAGRFGPSIGSCVVRWVATAVLLIAFLACLVANKLSTVIIAAFIRCYNSSDQHHVSIEDIYIKQSSMLWLLLSVLLPYMCLLVQSMWQGACRGDRPWPSCSAMIWGVSASVLESIGISMFTLGVLCRHSGRVTIWVMNGVFLVPILLHLLSEIRSHDNKRTMLALGIAFIFEIVGIVLTCILEVTKIGLDNPIMNAWEIPVSLILLSIAWSPQVQKKQLYPRQADFQRLFTKSSLYRPTGDEEQEDLIDPSTVIFVHPEFSCRWKISCIMSLLKLILIIACCSLYLFLSDSIDFRVKYLTESFLYMTPSHQAFPAFMVNIFCSLSGSFLGFLGCTMSLQKLTFAWPLILATPLSCAIVIIDNFLPTTPWDKFLECNPQDLRPHDWLFVVFASVCLVLAQILSTALFIFKTQTIIMQKASQLFWMPGYNSIFLEQVLLLGRKTVQTNRQLSDVMDKARQTHVIICTTMYREAAHEMEQLLKSIKHINMAKQMSDRNIQSHIFFDNGVRGTKLTEFALQLVCIVKSTLGVTSAQCTKVLTPYGMRLNWLLPSIVPDKRGMCFILHLKDNQKVKSKKRWSQVMYMSYVVDYFLKDESSASFDNTFILTTDADVQFTPESVEALLDVMVRDSKVGAVCSRTFPLGSGPVYWYQIFDYAIGHWFIKAANHMLGSVLCCPGCFSVYRVEAISDVLPIYGSQVGQASEFLTKDMGEDRWLCTLMVQCGWRLEYCAVANNSTYCPLEFDEFFKQRRRWIPSTLANQILLLQEWKTIKHFNKGISYLFMLYQALLLFSTLINPSVSILIIVGGLYYAWSVQQLTSTILLIIITLGFTAICLYCTQDTQLLAAKILTCLSAIVMAAVFIGTIVQIVEENTESHPHSDVTTVYPRQFPVVEDSYNYSEWFNDPDPTTPEPFIRLPLSVTTIYLCIIVGIFVLTAVLHLPEFYCLFHGVWYLLCLPAGNLILMIYSICNMTDRSWGTREEKKLTDFPRSVTWKDTVIDVYRKIFFCCYSDNKSSMPTVTQSVQTDDTSDCDDVDSSDVPRDSRAPKARVSFRKMSSSKSKSDDYKKYQFGTVTSRPLNINEWLPLNLQEQYQSRFESHGYDDTSFVYGMADSDLKEIGINMKGHRNAICAAIQLLPEPEIEPCVPEHIGQWLDNIGLSQYLSNFQKAHIVSSSNMETLKLMSREDIKKELQITKQGHQKRLLLAINKLRYPTLTEKASMQAKYELEALHLHNMKTVSRAEYDFWEKLRLERLLPDSVVFAHDLDLKAKLEELRNSTLLVFAIANAIWMILISTLVTKSQLNFLGTNVLGLAFLIIFGIILCVQFVCMIFHRALTAMHMIARAPDKRGKPYNASWAFRDRDIDPSTPVNDQADELARQEIDRLNNRLLRAYRRRVHERHVSVTAVNETVTERQPLLGNNTRNRQGISNFYRTPQPV